MFRDSFTVCKRKLIEIFVWISNRGLSLKSVRHQSKYIFNHVTNENQVTWCITNIWWIHWYIYWIAWLYLLHWHAINHSIWLIPFKILLTFTRPKMFVQNKLFSLEKLLFSKLKKCKHMKSNGISRIIPGMWPWKSLEFGINVIIRGLERTEMGLKILTGLAKIQINYLAIINGTCRRWILNSPNSVSNQCQVYSQSPLLNLIAVEPKDKNFKYLLNIIN